MAPRTYSKALLAVFFLYSFDERGAVSAQSEAEESTKQFWCSGARAIKVYAKAG